MQPDLVELIWTFAEIWIDKEKYSMSTRGRLRFGSMPPFIARIHRAEIMATAYQFELRDLLQSLGCEAEMLCWQLEGNEAYWIWIVDENRPAVLVSPAPR